MIALQTSVPLWLAAKRSGLSAAERYPLPARILETIGRRRDILLLAGAILPELARRRVRDLNPVSAYLEAGRIEEAVRHLLGQPLALRAMLKSPDIEAWREAVRGDTPIMGLAIVSRARRPPPGPGALLHAFFGPTPQAEMRSAVEAALAIIDCCDVADLPEAAAKDPRLANQLVNSLAVAAQDHDQPEHAAIALRAMALLGSERAIAIVHRHNYVMATRGRVRLAAIDTLGHFQLIDEVESYVLAKRDEQRGRSKKYYMYEALVGSTWVPHFLEEMVVEWTVPTTGSWTTGRLHETYGEPMLSIRIPNMEEKGDPPCIFRCNLSDILRHGPPSVRRALLVVLGQHFHDNDYHWTPLLRALADPDGEVRRKAIEILGSDAVRAEDARHRVFEMAIKRDEFAAGAAEFLARRTDDVRDLLEIIRLGDSQTRLIALRGLARFKEGPATPDRTIGPTGGPLDLWKETLESMLRNEEDIAVKRVALERLAEIYARIGNVEAAHRGERRRLPRLS